MKHIHPFPARMAPDIALSKIADLSKGHIVLDPMSGSGMVLSQAARSGLKSIGYDLDPLARMISRVGATSIDEDKAKKALSDLIETCSCLYEKHEKFQLKWIDDDRETSDFIDFWFDKKQSQQLNLLSYFLFVKPIIRDKKIIDILKIALSRLIITKEPKASLARDTAHSRPHKTIFRNDFDIFSELPSSLNHVLKALDTATIKVDTETYLGDARKMTRISNESIDAIITSPPYLNAIDYIRGHRLSLVWFGYNLSKLRSIRRKTIGTERLFSKTINTGFVKILKELELENLDDRNLKMLYRYYYDLTLQLNESYRVLKRGASATYVIGNSTIRGNYIRNNELLKRVAISSGFDVKNESMRKIPNNRRYMPLDDKSGSALAFRMREEHIIELLKLS